MVRRRTPLTTGPITVLHVDDERAFARLAADRLERESDRIDAIATTSAADALERLADPGVDVDCVVSDYDMPDRTGIEFLTDVREIDPDLPFVLYTGKGSEEIASEAISAGVTDYLQKDAGTDQFAILANRIENAVEAVRSRRQLTERNRRLETLIDNLPGVVYRCRDEPGWPMEQVEGDWAALTGYDATTIEAGTVSWGEDVVHPNDRGEVWTAAREAIDAGEPFEVTYRIRTRAGETRWVRGRGRLVEPADADGPRIEGFMTDVTELRERERRLEALATSFPDVAFIIDEDGRHVENLASPDSEELLVTDSDELLGRRLHDELPEATADELLETIHRTIETGETRTVEYRLDVEAGTRWFEARTSPLEGRVDGRRAVVWVSRDVTRRRERESELERIHDRMEFALEATDSIIFETDLESREETRHGPFEELYGIPSGEVPTTDAFYERCVHPDDREAIERLERRESLRGVSNPLEFEYRTNPATGEVRWLTSQSYVQTDAAGEPERLIGLVTDATERRRRERSLERKNERLDEFVSVVSHDLRNPLNVAEGRLALARETLGSAGGDDRESRAGDGESGDPDAGAVDAHLREVAHAHDRMRRLIDDLLTLAREGDHVGEVETVRLDELVSGCWRTVETAATADLVVETDRAVRADASRLRQLVENLLRNAVEHAGAEVTITVTDTDDGFAVADDGPGIPAEERERIFESGYSTTTDGTGFGLAIVREIADAHGWGVAASESESGGARIDVTGVELG